MKKLKVPYLETLDVLDLSSVVSEHVMLPIGNRVIRRNR